MRARGESEAMAELLRAYEAISEVAVFVSYVEQEIRILKDNWCLVH